MHRRQPCGSKTKHGGAVVRLSTAAPGAPGGAGVGTRISEACFGRGSSGGVLRLGFTFEEAFYMRGSTSLLRNCPTPLALTTIALFDVHLGHGISSSS